MQKSKRKNKIWGIIDVLILLVQLLCSIGFAYVVKDLLPQKYWALMVVFFAVLIAALGTTFVGLFNRISKKNRGRLANVIFWIISLVISVVLVYGASVLDQGLDTLDDVTDVTYQTHIMNVMVKADSTYEKMQDLEGKTVGIIEGMGDDENNQKALEEIQTKENVTLNTQGYASLMDAYNAVMADEIDGILANDAFSMVIGEIIPEYSTNIKTIYQAEVQEEITLSEDVELDNDMWSDEDMWAEDMPDVTVEPTEEPTPTPDVTAEPTEEPTPTATPTPTKKPTPTPTKAPTPTPVKRPSNPVVTKDTFNVFISGIDTYGGVSTVSRSDVNMIVTVNPKTKQILMTSIPRDYYVKLASKGAYDKLTHAGLYGINESVRTLQNLFGIQIDYYVKVNFSSLVKIVDALGGITVNNPTAFLDFPAGNIELNGTQALRFCRERYSFASGDNARVKNQQRVLTGIINKAISPAIITNYSSILSAVSGSFVTNMSSSEIQSLIQMQLNDMSSWSISQISVTGSGSYSSNCYSMRGYSLYIMKPSYSSVYSATNKINALF